MTAAALPPEPADHLTPSTGAAAGSGGPMSAEGGAVTGWPEVRLPALVGIDAALVLVAAAVGLSADQATLLLLAAAVVGAVGARTWAAAGGAAAGWALLTGFVVNDLGLLTLTTADAGRLALFVGAAVTTSWCVRQELPLHRSGRRRPSPLGR